MKNNTAAPRRPANNNVPLLTLERAIADNISPKQLRDVAAANSRAARDMTKDEDGAARRRRTADHLLTIANKLELLGYGRAA